MYFAIFDNNNNSFKFNVIIIGKGGNGWHTLITLNFYFIDYPL